MLITRHRAHMNELLDQPDASQEDIERSLSDLEWVNRWLGGTKVLLTHVLPVMEQSSKILDVACGGGDVLRAVYKSGKQKGIEPYLVGVDVNPEILSSAIRRSQGYENISYVKANAMSLPFDDDSFDIVYSTTFLHHLEPTDIVVVLKELARTTLRRLVVTDLIRHDLALIGILILGSLLFGRISRYDGQASVRKAYRPDELAELARQAGLSEARIYTHPFFRMALVYDKTVSPSAFRG